MPDGPDARGLRIVLTDESGRPVRARALTAWLGRVAPARARGLVAIALVPDATMRRLNRRYAGQDRATDVLSFPAQPPADGRPAGRSARPGRFLGDIAIATGVARRHARAAGHPYGEELRVLSLHGLLHLLGYDHHADDGAMARLEARLRRKGGLSAGLIERAGPR
jgi:probable rRNA maturation factor